MSWCSAETLYESPLSWGCSFLFPSLVEEERPYLGGSSSGEQQVINTNAGEIEIGASFFGCVWKVAMETGCVEVGV